MRLAILSDIHANYDALQPVLADADMHNVEMMVCLGDCIGYGPEPEAVLREIRRRGIHTIIGNHEMAVCDPEHLKWFNPMARISLKKTMIMLSPESLSFIRGLPLYLTLPGCRCVHGYPPDSAQTYLFQIASHELQQTLKTMAEEMCFIGHTHDLEIIDYGGGKVIRRPLREGSTPLASNHRYLVNVGSVGQPRDGTNHAKYVIWDQERSRIETRFIRYDIARTVAKIKAAGLPEIHADRLW